MTVPTFTMRQLIEAGVHFGHQTHRWNPKMKPYLFGARNNIHIIDLQQSVPLLHRALHAVRDIVAGGGSVDTPAAFSNMTGPLLPPPHQKPGVIRIPHGRGGFGAAARDLAAKRRAEGAGSDT